MSPSAAKNAHDGAPSFCPVPQLISRFIFTHKSGRPVPRPPAQSLHTTPPHDRKARTQPAGRRSPRDARDFLLSPLSVCGIAGIVHVRIAPASATLYGNRAHRATASNYSGGRSVERAREREPTSRSTSSTPRSVHPKFSHTLTRHGPPPGSTCPAHAT